MADPSRSSPISLTSYLTNGDEVFPAVDHGSQIGSAVGSLQGEGILSGNGDGGSDGEFGFHRPELGKEALVGTVQFFERHVFLCYKTPHAWPSHVEAPGFDRLPRLLSAAIAAKKGEMKKRTRLTICEGEDGTESSNGDVLIFPDMMRYRRLTHFDVDNFVEEVLVKDSLWLPGEGEALNGTFIFVCSHGNRDRRCGVCGPILTRKLKEEIDSRGLHGQVSVSPCSHIGGHKYAGNVIIFSSSINGEVTGHWYGYVTPDDVPLLFETHIIKGEIVNHLWRGQMGLTKEDQKKVQDLKRQTNSATEDLNLTSPIETKEANALTGSSCCRGVAASSCCQYKASNGKSEKHQLNLEELDNREILLHHINNESKPKPKTQPSWFNCWEREDTYAALAVVTAIASIAVAYSCYKQLR